MSDGATAPPSGGPFTGLELGFNADVQLIPGITSISPSSGPGSGGTSVTVRGHDFTTASKVSFGGVSARSFTVNSDTSITAITNAGSPGTVDVAVTTAGGKSPSTGADLFTYVPGVSLVSPSSGPRTGGRGVSITGQGFIGASAVRFGGVSARSFTVKSDTLITAISPAASPGTVDVTVTTAGAQSPRSSADRFTFNQVCVVPKLKGKTLKKAKKALKTAHCRLGEVKPKGETTGKVKKQKPKAGTVLPVGSKVNIRLR